MIFLDLKVRNVVSKAVYELGCSGIAMSQKFVQNTDLKPTQVGLLALYSEMG